MVRKRPLIAAALSLYPGLGHAYLRRWLRALLWFGLVVSAVAFVAPEAALDGSVGVFEGAQMISGNLSTVEEFALVSILGFSMLDAYLLAEHGERQSDDGVPTCPHCGQELDEDLDFCHWCTSRLDEPTEEESV
ncbi:zinc ribbon domain-containing protein [Natronoarchaeum mannanilyticum]|uniref:Zinc ribbon domain-containing protein n=1 Tax=Natronoarchaeum mannanilyticum TaxID=926360 RepID=A0AAV3T5W7_9EURY